MLSSLLEEFEGKVDLIYIDPPFATGADFSYSVEIGDRQSKLSKLPSMMEVVAYRDMWKDGIHSYLPWMAPLLSGLSKTLAPSGSIYVHCDATISHHIRGCLQHHMGQTIRREIIWQMKSRSGYKSSANNWIRDHDTIFYLNRGPNPTFNTQFEPYSEDYIRKMFKGRDKDGRRFRQRDNRRYYEDEDGIPHGDVWSDISSFQTATRSAEYTGYPTQKPEALLERIISASSNEGDLVLDCFVGSGTTAAVAEKLGRRWIGVDIGRFAIQTTRKRLLEIPGCRPFELQNLGKYERRHWQGADGNGATDYIAFILDLYKAQPKLDQFQQLHGFKEGRAVHVGATDSPVTKVEVTAAVDDCRANGITKLDILGWEFEMGINTQLGTNASGQVQFDDVAVRNFRIPREVLDKRNIDAGSINFFELSVARAEVIPGEHGLSDKVSVHLTDYIARVDQYMQDKLTAVPTKWSDWIDYWSVDFEYEGEVFINQWQAYRTRQDRSLVLESDPHIYDTPGAKVIVVKIIDIFGNDTTLGLKHEVQN